MTTIVETIESVENEISHLIDLYLEFPLPISETLLAGIEKRIGEHPRPDSICLSVSLRKKQLAAMFEFSELRRSIKLKQLQLKKMREERLELEARWQRLLDPTPLRAETLELLHQTRDIHHLR